MVLTKFVTTPKEEYATVDKYFHTHKYHEQPHVNALAEKKEQPKSDVRRNLETIGKEGFDNLDEYLENHKYPQPHVNAQAIKKEEQPKSDVRRNLETIGKEGFDRLDEYFKNHKYPQPHVNAQANSYSYRAARMYGGTYIAELCKNKEPLMRLPKSYNYK
ncbi:hypothetical protein POM88_015705 [Heracleum sosnowskyi]|uniref:Uncharacterized protein n=1 Tax=Heracleum sosnowskyi TaxID=360622 RepID=A0AAD8MWN0_9APIA|nr:hypothetical protein POM88_015705 [Heracleum sosnowskyi]